MASLATTMFAYSSCWSYFVSCFPIWQPENQLSSTYLCLMLQINRYEEFRKTTKKWHKKWSILLHLDIIQNQIRELFSQSRTQRRAPWPHIVSDQLQQSAGWLTVCDLGRTHRGRSTGQFCCSKGSGMVIIFVDLGSSVEPLHLGLQ